MILAETIARAIAPPAKTTVSQWADRHRVLAGPAVAESGRWRTSRVEYTREIMDCFSDPAVETVSWMAASQVGKSELILNVAGYFVHVDPCPMLIVQDTLPSARDFSQSRLAPMIEETPCLRAKVAEPKGRDPDNTLLRKTYAGGQISLASAQSPGDLSGRPRRVVLADELGRYEDTREGDPVALMRRRTSNFWNRKLGFLSSPADKGTCRIEGQFLEGDRRRFHVPCPHCGREQVLRHPNVVWDKLEDENGNPVRDENGKLIHLPETARYACEACGSLWGDAERDRAVRRGRWVAERPFKGHASFHLNALYSPWVPLAKYADEFLKAKKLPGTLKVFVNTFMAETWEDAGESVDEDEIYRRAVSEAWEPKPAIPAQVAVITAAVDQQENRLEVEVIGWGRDEEAWSLLWVQIYGDPLLPEVWARADSVLLGKFTTADGRELGIRAAGVDTGGPAGGPEMAYAFCKSRWFRRVWALKGKARGLGVEVWPPRFSKRNKGNVPLFVVNVDEAKLVVTERLKIEARGPGYCHFPKDRPSGYFRMFGAERLVTKYQRGFPVKRWHRASGRPNEALDLWGYNYAVLCGLRRQGFDLNRECDRIVARRSADPAEGRPAAVRPLHAPGASMAQPADPYL
ncbi:MAG: phage terminase large subunit family protein [Desulfarculus sp.]|nr:MAG: phage terminase large subunit family protein [Desulfarculus sp.]